MAGLAAALAAAGHAVHVFTTTPRPSEVPGASVHAITSAMLGDVAAPALWRVPSLRDALLECGADVVHAHGMFSTLAIGALLAASDAGIPSITTHHSLLRPATTLPAAWLTYRLFSRCATLVSAVSLAAARDARRASGRADVSVLPNGLDLAAWRQAPRAGDPAGRPTRVVSVMRLAPKKAPRHLIDAVPVVLSKARREVVFTVVGDGPERAALERRAHALGVAAHVEFLGACDASAVAGVLARSDVFALPSPDEAFGLAVLEARAAGLPIVARSSGGVPEIVEHGRQGLLADSPRAFADAIAALVADDTLRRRLSEASGEGIELYGWDRVVESHEAAYHRALDGRVSAVGNRRGPRR